MPEYRLLFTYQFDYHGQPVDLCGLVKEHVPGVECQEGEGLVEARAGILGEASLTFAARGTRWEAVVIGDEPSSAMNALSLAHRVLRELPGKEGRDAYYSAEIRAVLHPTRVNPGSIDERFIDETGILGTLVQVGPSTVLSASLRAEGEPPRVIRILSAAGDYLDRLAHELEEKGYAAQPVKDYASTAKMAVIVLQA